jgi:hypothetical protein
MSGFPRRPSRKTFGPTFKNERPVRNPETQASAELVNLLAFQVAGGGLMVPRAWVIFDATGGPADPPIIAGAQSWNPDGNTTPEYAPPVIARTSAGLYTINYNSDYPDENGELVPIGILTAFGRPVESANVRHVACTLSGGIITARLRESDLGTGAWTSVDGKVFIGIL